MINIKQWKRRCEEALKLSGRKATENGEDMTKYFGNKCATIFEDVSEGDCMNEFVKERNAKES